MQVKAIEELESIPAGENHFRFDSFHMGSDVAKDLLIMFMDFENNPYLILCNKVTGERTKIWLDLSPVKENRSMNRYKPERYVEVGQVPVVEWR